ncbi:hypothetical protein HaLaN_13316 [Haematococcus lacustris]|uniref:Uncharacterized protein n=1 Tax=Haematococcus lacustris TaxID=44745 RepID=A0A699ZCS7_HAELA|nr:hypothetical protein HaLaN_13316 [Haematococcus lacustris]
MGGAAQGYTAATTFLRSERTHRRVPSVSLHRPYRSPLLQFRMQHMQDGTLTALDAALDMQARVAAVQAVMQGVSGSTAETVDASGILTLQGEDIKGGSSAGLTAVQRVQQQFAAAAVGTAGVPLSECAVACGGAGLGEKLRSRGRVAFIPVDARVRCSLEGDVPSTEGDSTPASGAGALKPSEPPQGPPAATSLPGSPGRTSLTQPGPLAPQVQPGAAAEAAAIASVNAAHEEQLGQQGGCAGFWLQWSLELLGYGAATASPVEEALAWLQAVGDTQPQLDRLPQQQAAPRPPQQGQGGPPARLAAAYQLSLALLSVEREWPKQQAILQAVQAVVDLVLRSLHLHAAAGQS